MFLLLLAVVFLLIFALFTFSFNKLINLISAHFSLVNAAILDDHVDEIVEKAVIIAEDLFRNEDRTQEKTQQKIVERASCIVADVMLQHGIKPKDFHLPALIGVARYNLGFDNLKQE
jgi:hypothetical protein